jgi:hypothetical protein
MLKRDHLVEFCAQLRWLSVVARRPMDDSALSALDRLESPSRR